MALYSILSHPQVPTTSIVTFRLRLQAPAAMEACLQRDLRPFYRSDWSESRRTPHFGARERRDLVLVAIVLDKVPARRRKAA